jgi:hypothetical protein
LRRGARNLGDKDAGVVVGGDDPVGRFDVQGASGVADADLNALAGDDQGAALDTRRCTRIGEFDLSS